MERQSNTPNVSPSRLVGSIVEKGVSGVSPFSPIQPPTPTVLPFPVARHRSHGPHWSPAGRKASGNKDEYEDDGEEEHFMHANSIAAFAKPVQRKKKQEVEFRRWKELVSADDSASTKILATSIQEPSKVEKHTVAKIRKKVLPDSSVASVDAATSMEVDNMHTVPTKTSESRTEFPTTRLDMELDHPEIVNHTKIINSEVNINATTTRSPTSEDRISYNGTAKACHQNSPASAFTSSRFSGLGGRQAPSSLETEIDAENFARLQRMSPEEIAEAQAEIMEKMDPALLSLLKKRGQHKLKKQTHLSAASTANMETNTVKTESQFISPDVHSWQSETDTSSASNFPVNQKQSSAVQNSGRAQGLLWDTWIQRVEAVRDLRFSLDGNVVEDDFVPATEAGDKRSNFESAAERDFLRTEGDPGAAGYTFKEAIALARSAVPGQRCLALHLLASVLGKALYYICRSRISFMRKDEDRANKPTDWEAVWAYALGPEPELVLALRLALDDNHSSVVLACTRVILCLLSCDLNENFFDISENMAMHGKDIFTAPVFRSKPEIDLGFLHGGYWKYSAKPSNILPSREEIADDGTEDACTIQDDVYVAGQDIAAGLVRMEILPRIYYLLETEPTAAVEESIISILIAIARHSPTCTNAILEYPRLVETIVKRFNFNKRMEVLPSQIKSVCLLKVLARFDKRTCVEFVKDRTLDAVTWHLFQFISSLDSWVKLGKEKCKLLSALMVEQLRLWKVCVQKGCCISRFSELFPALCLWLSCPSFEKLMEKNLICEFASVSKEAYLILEALAGTLPNIYSQDIPRNDSEAWDWSYVSPMIDTALSWITLAPRLIEQKRGVESRSATITSLLWVYSAVINTISRVLKKVTANGEGEPLPWLPEFVPKIGLTIIKQKLLGFCAADESMYAKDSSGCSSFVESLCCLRQQSKDEELSLASVSCLRGLIQTVASIQTLIRSARSGMKALPQECISSRVESVLAKGILTESLAEIRSVWNVFRDSVASEWPLVQSGEVHRRGGPAPGVGIGWGATGGGFWSTRVLLAQADAYFLSLLLNIFLVDSDDMNSSEDRESAFMMERINSGLAVCLIAGPRDHILVDKTLDFVLQPHGLERLALCVKSNKRFRAMEWEYTEENYLHMSNVLASHYRRRWLEAKIKSKAKIRDPVPAAGLETIHEDSETSDFSGQAPRKYESLIVEWVHQRLPLPPHWFLSAISAVCDKTSPGLPESLDLLEVTKAGVFLLAGLESVSDVASHPSPVASVPLVWKFHTLSAALLAGMDVLEDKTTGRLYESLQELYGQLLDEARLNCGETELLRFKSDIHDNYSVFLERLVEQYAAVSYGDILYGRQVAIYLHQCVEPSVRLAAWNVLSSARVLELLPSLEKCLGQAEGYLEPVEHNEAMVDAYLKSWTCGELERAARRGSVAFTVVVHYFSSLIFWNEAEEKRRLRNKVVKTLVRDYSKKQGKREGMMVTLLRNAMEEESEMEKRLEVLKEACQGNSSLLAQLHNLSTAFHQTTTT